MFVHGFNYTGQRLVVFSGILENLVGRINPASKGKNNGKDYE